MGHCLGLTPFLAISGLYHFVSKSTLDFGPWSMKLGGAVRAIKKWPPMTMKLFLAGIIEKGPFLRLAEKRFFGQKSVFSPKKSPKIA